MDKISPERRSANMRAIRSKGMKPELFVRRLVYSLGYRFRLHRKDLPGKPDLAFIGRKKAIFVHGCFWHQHPDPHCADARVPKSNLDYWMPKLERNVERDAAQRRALEARGWKVLTVWDCETKDLSRIQQRIRTFLDSN
jgi:DNA mismatch endonuclease (patch repair protein)